MRLAWWRDRREPVDDIVDLRNEETIDLRDAGRPIDDRYLRPKPNDRSARDRAAEEWARSAALVEYPPDLEDWRADRHRDSLEPGHLSAAALFTDADRSPGPRITVLPRADGRWAVQQEGATQASRLFDNRADAEEWAQASHSEDATTISGR